MKNFFNQKKIDYYILQITFIFFLIINFIYFYINLVENSDTNIYAFNELFINYQAGFIRRGLLGEIAWQLNKIFFVEPRVFFSFLFLTIYFFQIILFFNLFKKFIVSKSFFFHFFFTITTFISYLQSRFIFFKRCYY